MAGRLPPEWIDQLLARTDLVELIGSRLQLRKAGREFQAQCPFHVEKTPSFYVSPIKQFYHCFGCGAHGNAIGFLMEYDRLAFREAVEELAERAGLELPHDGDAAQSAPDYSPLYRLLDAVAAYYRRQLREHPDAPRAVAYLKGRGLSGEIAARFGLGYAPAHGNPLLNQFGSDAAARARLQTAGLISEREGQVYDKFRDRVLFPIRDRRGRIIGFGGRIIGEGKPKYLNSPETPIFHKGRALYGLYEAQRANRTFAALIVVEGYLDVIALAQFGITNAVATLGTATTPEHLSQLLKLAPEIVFCFDGDRAGRAAAWKALETALPLATGHQALRFLFLPEGDDPDTLVRRDGAEGFRARLAQAQPLSDFLFEHLSADQDTTTLDGRARFASQLQPYLERLPPGLYRELLLQRLADYTGAPPPRPPSASAARRRLAAQRAQPARPSLVAQAIALLLDRPDLAPHALALNADWKRSTQRGIDVLIGVLDRLGATPDLSTARLLEHWREHPHFGYLQQLSIAPFLRDLDASGAEAELIDALERLNNSVRETEWRHLLNKRRPSDWTPEERAQLAQHDWSVREPQPD
ncbi:DNA primase [Allochromatium warmingii]|uniref:DNA primase n=1 Tax=Allochromatium warmingii TaxID=61595 RepID=A0A1H3GNR0_ALLWA|nr:DNA primase [Allochromatium warmingii]SDY04946.1 DNA primase [Allochromatium warmingii]